MPTTDAQLPDWMVRCDECVGWHHPDYHSNKPFQWGRRVLAWLAWQDTKRLVRAWWKVLRG